jgi:hypothetical protein
MVSLKGTNKLFWGKEFEDVLDWTKRLKIALKMQRYDELFFILFPS